MTSTLPAPDPRRDSTPCPPANPGAGRSLRMWGGGGAIVRSRTWFRPVSPERHPPEPPVHRGGADAAALHALRDSVRVRTDRRPTTHPLRRLPVQPRKARRHQVACAAPASPGRGADVRCRRLPDAVEPGRPRRAVSPRRSGARPGQPAGALPSSQRQQRRKDRLHAAAAVRVRRSVLPGSVAPVNPSEKNLSTAITRLDTEGDARVVAQEGHFLGVTSKTCRACSANLS